MTWVDGQVKGWNLRSDNTGAYASIDVSPDTYLIGGDTYPQTRNDVTFGQSDGDPNVANKGNADSGVVDKRFAGKWYASPAISFTIRVDLPAAGVYKFRMANGSTDSDFSPYRQIIVVKDTASTVFTHDSGAGSTGPVTDNYVDASEVSRSEAGWAAANVGVNLTFATTICNVVVGGGSAGYTTLAHFSLEKIAAGVVAPTLSSITPSSAYANASSGVTLLNCFVIGTGLNVAHGAGGATLTCNDGDIVAVSPVYTSATRIDFYMQMNAGTAVGAKTWTVTTNDGTSNTVAFTVSDPAGSGGGGGSIFTSPIISGGITG